VRETLAGVPGRAHLGGRLSGVPAQTASHHASPSPGSVIPPAPGAGQRHEPDAPAPPAPAQDDGEARRPAQGMALQGLHAASVTLVTAYGHRSARWTRTRCYVQARNHRPFTRPGERGPIAPATSRRRSPCSTRAAATAGEDDLTPVPDDVIEQPRWADTPGHADLAATASTLSCPSR